MGFGIDAYGNRRVEPATENDSAFPVLVETTNCGVYTSHHLLASAQLHWRLQASGEKQDNGYGDDKAQFPARVIERHELASAPVRTCDLIAKIKLSCRGTRFYPDEGVKAARKFPDRWRAKIAT